MGLEGDRDTVVELEAADGAADGTDRRNSDPESMPFESDCGRAEFPSNIGGETHDKIVTALPHPISGESKEWTYGDHYESALGGDGGKRIATPD